MLRAPQPGDIDALYEIQGDRVAMRFTYCAPSRAATAAFVEEHAARFPIDGHAPWTAVLEDGQRVVGWGGLGCDPQAPQWGRELMYFFDPAFWGRGFASELVQAALTLGFADLGLDAIGAFAHPGNLASIRVLENAGFERIGFAAGLGRYEFRLRRQGWSPVAVASSAGRVARAGRGRLR